ncbi:MAG TPA: hypothetical protein VFE16_00220 [Candidatus Cybelea sp.]|nr:hypothetical protein [Candidatus Cybelea sp.]
MPIHKDRIRSDVTLELDDPSIAMNEFGKAVDHFLGLVKDISRVTAPAKDPSAWDIEIYEGSAGIGLRHVSGAYSFDEVQRISATFVDGIRTIASGVRPPSFTDAAVNHSRALASLVNRRQEQMAVRIWVGSENVVSLNKEVAVKAERLLAPAYEDDGSVDGVLEKANGHDRREFVVFDTLTNRGITCSVDEALMHEAVRYFFKRVEVLGKVRYRTDGQPVSVRATNIVPFPEPEEIPTLEEMRALLKGA